LKSWRYSKNVEIFSISKRYNRRYIGCNGKNADLPLEILSQFNFIIGIFTIKPKLSEFYSDCVNAFCPCYTYVRRRQYMRGWSPLKTPACILHTCTCKFLNAQYLPNSQYVLIHSNFFLENLVYMPTTPIKKITK